MVSRDGLVLGVFPPEEEERTVRMWKGISALGDVDHGFVAGSDETWAFSRRGPYSAVAVAASSVRPGVILHRLDEVLALAGQAHGRNAEPSTPEGERAAESQSGQPDTQRWLQHRRHRGAKPRWTGALAASAPSSPADAPGEDEEEPPDTPQPAPESPVEDEPQTVAAPEEEAEEHPAAEHDEPTVSWDVDPFSLAREFAGLIPDAEKEK